MGSKIQLCVIGRNINNKKWDCVWEALDEGKEYGVNYEKFDMDNMPKKAVADLPSVCCGIIYLGTTATSSEGPHIVIPVTLSENAILGKIEKFLGTLFEVIEPSPVEEIATISCQKLESITIELGSKKIVLNKEDAILLEKLLTVTKEYGFKVVDITAGDQIG